MKPKKETVKKYTMSELRELDDSQLDEIIASRKYLKEVDRSRGLDWYSAATRTGKVTLLLLQAFQCHCCQQGMAGC